MKTSLFTSDTVVVVAAFWVNFCLLGVLRSNAVIYRAFVEVFDVNRQYAAWPSGIFGFFMCVTGALSGFLNGHLSTQTLALIGASLASASVSICCLANEMPLILFLYGALQGIGMGLIVPLTHVVLNQHFTKYRACALGFAYSGSSLGSLVFPVFTNILLQKFDLQGTFLLLGGIMSNSLIGAMFFRKPQSLERKAIRQNCKMTMVLTEKQDQCVTSSNEDGEDSLWMKVLANPYFYLVSLAFAAFFSTSAIFLMVVLDFAKDRGVSTEAGVFLISAFSLGDFVGRLSFGWIADVRYIRRSILVRCYLLSMGVLTALFPTFPTEALLVTSVLLGIINGSIIVNHSVLLNEYLGIQKLPIAMGFSTCFVGITAFFRPIIIGAFRDGNKSYDHVFLFMGLFQVATTLLWFFEAFLPKKNQVKEFLKPVMK